MAKRARSPSDPQTTLAEMAAALGVAKRALECRARRDVWTFTEERARSRHPLRFYGLSQFPGDIQAKILLYRNRAAAPEALPSSALIALSEPADATLRDREALWERYGALPTARKEEAQRRLKLLDQVMMLVAHGIAQRAAFAHVGKASGVPFRTIEQWYHGTKKKPGVKRYDRADWLAALADDYVGGHVRAELSEEAWETLKGDYLRLEKPALTACYARLLTLAPAAGWQIPSIRTVARRLENDIPRAIQVLKREGEQALQRLYPPLERSVANLHALEAINGDGYEHNVFVRWSANEKPQRPKTWFWQDVYSRKILAFRVDMTENADMIRAALADVLGSYGVPRHVTLDNTRAAANKWLSGSVRHRYRFTVKDDDPVGIFLQLGVQVHWTSVFNGRGHGQAKPVERAFGHGGIGEVVDKHPAFAGAYTGNSPIAKPENYGETAVPLETFLQVLTSEIAAWNARTGRRTEMANGVLSFDQVFEASYRASPITKATERQRQLLLLCAEAVTVQRDGSFTLDAGARAGEGRGGRNRYFANALHEYIGQKITVHFDPQMLHDQVIVSTLDGRHICDAACIEPVGFYDTVDGRTYSRHRNQWMKAIRQAAAAEERMSAMNVARTLPLTAPAEIPDAKVVRMLQQPAARNTTPALSPERTAEIEAWKLDFLKPAPEPARNVTSIEPNQRLRFMYWELVDEVIGAGCASWLDEADLEFHCEFQRAGAFEAFHETFAGLDPAGQLPEWAIEIRDRARATKKEAGAGPA